MSGSGWGLLPQAEEDALHNVSRLLAVEARPYMQVAGHILKPGFFEDARPKQLPSPPPDASAADQNAAALVVDREQQHGKIELWRRDILNELSLLDFATLRAEFTTNSNSGERKRYAVDKEAITGKQQQVRETIEALRGQLVEAKKTLAIRKQYDELTEKITSSKMLKPRDEQAVAHQKLDEEIEELENEVATAGETWRERRIQFSRIEDAAREMLRMIKDEKEEAERKEGMMKDGDEDGDGEGEGSTSRGDTSRIGTPRPDGGMTPMHPGQSMEGSASLKVPSKDRLHPLSRDTSVAPSLNRSTGADDVEMTDQGANHDDDDDSSGLEEGEDVEDGEEEEEDKAGNRMDES